MSRTYKKNPVTGHTTAPSEKQFKRRLHSVRRMADKQTLRGILLDNDSAVFKKDSELRNGDAEWLGDKDGKSAANPDYERQLRFLVMHSAEAVYWASVGERALYEMFRNVGGYKRMLEIRQYIEAYRIAESLFHHGLTADELSSLTAGQQNRLRVRLRNKYIKK